MTNLRHDYYTLCMARHGNVGVVNPGTATAAPRGHFDGGYVGPGIRHSSRSFFEAGRRWLLGAWPGSEASRDAIAFYLHLLKDHTSWPDQQPTGFDLVEPELLWPEADAPVGCGVRFRG